MILKSDLKKDSGTLMTSVTHLRAHPEGRVGRRRARAAYVGSAGADLVFARGRFRYAVEWCRCHTVGSAQRRLGIRN